jgi:hypothetical protein
LLHSIKLKGRPNKENVALITLARWQVTSDKKRQEKKNFEVWEKQDGVISLP